MGPELPFGEPGVLGLATTWPQAACVLPSPPGYEFDWQGDRCADATHAGLSAGLGWAAASDSRPAADAWHCASTAAAGTCPAAQRHTFPGPLPDHPSPQPVEIHSHCPPPPHTHTHRPLNLPMEDLVIYEMHVRGYTQHPTSATISPGTYAGMVERLDYLQGLGVNCVELLPVQEFNELEYYSQIPGSEEYRWGSGGTAECLDLQHAQHHMLQLQDTATCNSHTCNSHT
jgi:hypothetical protein